MEISAFSPRAHTSRSKKAKRLGERARWPVRLGPPLLSKPTHVLQPCTIRYLTPQCKPDTFAPGASPHQSKGPKGRSSPSSGQSESDECRPGLPIVALRTKRTCLDISPRTETVFAPLTVHLENHFYQRGLFFSKKSERRRARR